VGAPGATGRARRHEHSRRTPKSARRLIATGCWHADPIASRAPAGSGPAGACVANLRWAQLRHRLSCRHPWDDPGTRPLNRRVSARPTCVPTWTSPARSSLRLLRSETLGAEPSAYFEPARVRRACLRPARDSPRYAAAARPCPRRASA
jgi:hypothetical protein